MFLGTRASLPFVYLGMATTIMASIRGQVRLYRRSSFPLMSIASVAAVEVSHLDGRHHVELRARRVVAEPHAGGAREVLAGVGRVVHEQELEQVLQLLAREVAGHEGAAGRRVDDAGAERRHGEHVVDRLHAGLPTLQAGAHHSVGGESDVGLRRLSEGVGDEVGEERAGGDVGERVGQVPRRDRQRLIDAVAARREHDPGDRLLEGVDLAGDGSVAGNGVVDRDRAGRTRPSACRRPARSPARRGSLLASPSGPRACGR